MFTIKTGYVCVLSLLLGASVMDVRGESLPDQPEAMMADTVTTNASPVSTRRAPIDPFTYKVQDRHLEKGVDFLSDSIHWYNHISLGVFSGAAVHGGHVSEMHGFGSRINFGLPVGLMASYQINRLHGVRLLYQYNRFSHNYRKQQPITANEFGVGYTFNFTNYFKGYDPNARWNVSATASAFGALTKVGGERKLSARGEFGLLINYRLLRSLSVFVEPYGGMTTDDYDHDFTPHRYDFFAGVRAGVATHGAATTFFDHVRRNKNNLYQPTFWGQNFFLGASAGRMWTNARSLYGQGGMQPEAHFFVGYRFTPVHALRLQGGYFKTPENLVRSHHVMGELDYMINFTNMWRGYDPKRRFRVSGILGLGARYLENTAGDKLAPTAIAGLNFNYYIKRPQISLFVEPYGAYALSRSGGKNTLFGGVRGGVQLDLIDTYTYMPRYALTDHEMQVSSEWNMKPMSHFFFGASAGVMDMHNTAINNHAVISGNVFLGYRFTPVQALRLQATYFNVLKNNNRNTNIALRADYMLNFSNLLYGYKPSRRLNIVGFGGLGVKSLTIPGAKDVYGLTFAGGADVMYRVYKDINVFVEPFAQASYTHKYRQYEFDFGVNAGVAVGLEGANMYGKRMGGDYNPDWENAVWRHFFIGGSGGILGVHNSVSPNRSTYPMNIFAGYRFSPNHAVRFQGAYIKSNQNLDRKRHMSAELDYMLNFTNMFAPYKPNRLFNVIGYLGAGARYIEKPGTRDGVLAPMATLGIDLALRIKPGLSVFAEPHVDIAKGKGQSYYTMYYGANLGLALSFDELNAYSPRWGMPTAEWNPKPAQHLFFGSSIGWWRIQRTSDKNLAPITMFMGYRFSPNHALRLKAMYTKTKEKMNRDKHFSGGVDYMFNLSNMISGYKPNRPFNLIGFVGLGMRSVESPAEKKKRNDVAYKLMGNVGLDIAYRLTRNVNIFVEPYVGAVGSRRETDFADYFMGINAGLVFNLEDINEPYKGIRTNHNPIVEASYGWMFPTRTGAGLHGSGLTLDVRLGTWIDPYFGVRGSMVFENYSYSKYYPTAKDRRQGNDTGYANAKVIKGRVEGLFNPLNLSANWRENADQKKFELNLAAGIEMGVADKKYAIDKGDDKYAIYGITFAAQALYKVNPNTAIFIEPRYEYMNRWFGFQKNTTARYNKFVNDNVVTISGGVRVIRGTAAQREDERRLNFEQSIFLGGSFGGYKALGYYKRDGGGRLGKFGNLAIGVLITPVHGLKFNVQPSWYKVDGATPRKYTLIDYRLSYLLNFSNLYQSAAYRKVDFYWQIGAGLSTIVNSPKGAKKRAPSAHFGFLVAYNINKHWAITTEPLGQMVAKKKFLPGYGIKPRMAMMRVDLSVGAMWKF